MDRETTHPGLTLTCGNDVYPVGAHYDSEVSPATGAGSLLTINLIPQRYPDNYDIHFEAALPDGTHDLDTRRVFASRGATGTLSFTRSRDVPFADVIEPKLGSAEASIDFELDLAITETGCTLTTASPIHLVQTGEVRDCNNR